MNWYLMDHQDLLLYAPLSPVERYDGRESNNAGHNHDVILSTMWCGEVLRHKSCWRVLSERKQIKESYKP